MLQAVSFYKTGALRIVRSDRQVQVANKEICGNPGPCFPTHPGTDALHRKSPTPTLGHAARWWPPGSSGRPHRQVREVRGRGSQRRRSSSTLKNCGARRAGGTPDMGPDCDLKSACSVGAKRDHTVSARKWCSTL